MSQKPVVAPSGFEFPFFPFDGSTFVRITDRTRYKSDFLDGRDKNTYDQHDFDRDLKPYYLDIEVQSFLDCLKKSSLERLGIHNPLSGWDKFHIDIAFRSEEEGEPAWPVTLKFHKQLLDLGLLRELPDTRENQVKAMQPKTLKELRELGKKQGLKTSGNKDELINRILDNGKTKPPKLATLSNKYFPMVELVAEKYLDSITRQLASKPPAYHTVLWSQVAEEYGMLQELPPQAQSRAKYLLEMAINDCPYNF